MNPDRNGGSERLREAFSSLADRTLPKDGCPESDRLWAAVRLELSASERRALVDHISACPACAEAWRLAQALVSESPAAVPAGQERSRIALPWRWRLPQVMAAAAAIVVALGVGVYVRRAVTPPGAEPEYRRPEPLVVRSLLPAGEPLPREDCHLRWSPGPAGSRYDLTVTTEELEVVAAVERLEAPEFRVPEAPLSVLAPGAKILWRVEVAFPDGRRAASETFVSQLR